MKGLIRLGLYLSLASVFGTAAFAREKWIYAKTENCEIFSDASEEDARQLLLEVSQFRLAFLFLFKLPPAHEPRTTIILFARESQFAPYKPTYNGRTEKNVAGYCIPSADETLIALSDDHDPQGTRELIFHEYVHLLLHTHGIVPPPWIDEGLAELYSTFRIKNRTLSIGAPKPGHLIYLSQHSLMPLEKLFAVTHQSPEYNEASRQGIFYAESWALLHYWLCGKDKNHFRDRFLHFLDLEDAPNADPIACFNNAFGLDYDEMLDYLKGYLQSGQFLIQHVDLPPQTAANDISFRPAIDFERDVALADLRWRVSKSSDCALQLRQLAGHAPDSARLHEALAMVEMNEHDLRAADRQLEQAVQLGSDNAFAYCMSAAEQLAQLMPRFSLDYRFAPSDATFLRDRLDHAIALSPDYTEAYATLAVVEAFSEQPRIAIINRVQKLVDQVRNNQLHAEVLLSLAVVHWRLKDPAISRQIGELLANDSSLPLSIHIQAQILLDRLDLEAKPTKPIEPAGPEEKKNIKEATLNHAHALSYYGSGLAKKTEGDLDGAIADYSEAIALQPNFAPAYNDRGILRARKGDFDGAIADFDKTLELAPGHTLTYKSRGTAKNLKGDFEGAIADYTKAIGLTGEKGEYARFLLALVLRRLHRDDAPAGLVPAIKAWNDGWPRTVGRYLTDNLSEADLLAQAGQGNAETVGQHQCEAFYYAGMIHLLKNEPAAAREFFNKCVATNLTSFIEFQLARAELARLPAAPAAAR